MPKTAASSEIQNLGQNIKRMREARGMTVAELAPALGITPAALEKLEAGVVMKRMSSGVILRAAEFFGVKPQALFL